MELLDLLVKKNISQYRLAKMSDVPQTTISDICSNKTSIEKCSASTLHKLAKSLNVTVEDFLVKQIDNVSLKDYEVFKSSICHMYKSMDVHDFIKEVVSSRNIEKFYKNKEFAKSFYLVAMLDYACDTHHIERIEKYDFFRSLSLLEPMYPLSVVTLDLTMNTNKNKKESLKEALPQFKRFNIIESDIENVY